MPGTGLARKAPRAMRWAWHKVLPRLAAVLPGTSTPAKSAGWLAELLTGELRGNCNSAYFNYTGSQREPAAPAQEAWAAEDLAQGSERLLRPFV